jgi:hypothetical protein
MALVKDSHFGRPYLMDLVLMTASLGGQALEKAGRIRHSAGSFAAK